MVDKEFVVVESFAKREKFGFNTNEKYSLSLLLVAGHLLGY